MIKDQIIQHSSLNQGDNNNFFINAKTLTQNIIKICVFLCNFVKSKSPKTTLQKRYSNHEFYTSNCEIMCNFWKKCEIKQPETDKQRAIQLYIRRKTTSKSQNQPQVTVQKLHTLPPKNIQTPQNTTSANDTAFKTCVIKAMVTNSLKAHFAFITLPQTRSGLYEVLLQRSDCFDCRSSLAVT